MPSLGDISKRLFVGRPLRSAQLGETLLPKRIALPVFASDALSSVAYATEEILLVLSLGGLSLIHFTWYAAAGVAFLMLVVVASYRQNVHAYPSGGGDYEVATTNLGGRAGLTVASALMVDYVLTVAVSVSSGVANITSAVTSLQGHAVVVAVCVVGVIMLLNLRGVRESGTAFAIPTYAFIAGVAVLITVGMLKIATGHHLAAESAHYRVAHTTNYTGFALAFLLLRSFASGCTALTGVEAISNGVPAFQKPKSKNAATTLALLGGIAVSMFLAITALAIVSHVHVAANPHNLIGLPKGQEPKTVIAQVGIAVFGKGSFGFYYLQAMTALILVLAANTAFNGFPVLASILAHDGYLPRQLNTRGDRLAFSNGILLLGAFAMVLIIAFSASPTRLIQLYIVGVFVSFVNSQVGMIRHWNRNLPLTEDPARRRQMKRSRVINSIGAVVTALVLIIVVVSKFTEGAWIAIVAMGVLFAMMRGIRKHYDLVNAELVPEEGDDVLPSRIHAVVLVSKVHKATLRAVNYARATRPSSLVALTVDVDPEGTARLREEWERRGVPVPLQILNSPYREVTRPIIKYIKEINRSSPRDVVSVFIPEYVVGQWWEQILHNQNALRLKGRLLFMRGVMVTSVPYQLASSGKVVHGVDRPAPGDVRRPVEVKTPADSVILNSSMELEVGAVGHGGICVAHAADGRAVLVRHALPGERVRVVITEQKPSFLRADAVEVLQASPHRVAPPCAFAGPGRCGGCDWQHVALDEQRRLKAEVITAALQRIARIEREVVVEAVPGDTEGLGWRTRMRLAVGPDGVAGLHRYRSSEIEPITDCLIAHESLPVASVVGEKWPDVEGVDLQSSNEEVAAGRTFRIPEGGFWQVHPGAPDVLVETVRGFLALRPADIVLDLYAGVGLFAGAFASDVSDGEVVAVESSPAAARAAVANLVDLKNVRVVNDLVARWLARYHDGADAVVLDPPRKGAGPDVVQRIVAAHPRQVAYVACEPAALARDIAAFEKGGWELAELRAFDLFPMTAHVECVALLSPRS